MRRITIISIALFAIGCGTLPQSLQDQIGVLESLANTLLDDRQSVLGLRILDAEGDQEERTYFTEHPIRIGVVFEGAKTVTTEQVMIGFVQEHGADMSNDERG